MFCSLPPPPIRITPLQSAHKRQALCRNWYRRKTRPTLQPKSRAAHTFQFPPPPNPHNIFGHWPTPESYLLPQSHNCLSYPLCDVTKSTTGGWRPLNITSTSFGSPFTRWRHLRKTTVRLRRDRASELTKRYELKLPHCFYFLSVNHWYSANGMCFW